MLAAVALAKNYVIRDWLGRSQETRALENATLSLHAGQTIGIVGESGSGKSTLARCLVRLIEPSRGTIEWGGAEVAMLGERQLRPLRSRVQIIFQDPNRTLNPRRKVGESIIEGAINFGLSAKEAWALADQLMDQVGLPRECLQRYPAQFSGGQRQRLAIARALACRPAVLIADEAVSALDVSVQAQVLELLRDIQSEFALALLFITHDLRVASQICDRVIVMHNGSIVEEGLTSEVYACPKHDYTRDLLDAAPAGIDAFKRARISGLSGAGAQFHD
jgi:peptide/nickel transport system ATP-binding protein